MHNAGTQPSPVRTGLRSLTLSFAGKKEGEETRHFEIAFHNVYQKSFTWKIFPHKYFPISKWKIIFTIYFPPDQ